jgi:hypothetical protein
LRAVLKGVLRDHLGVPDVALAARVFPDSTAESDHFLMLTFQVAAGKFAQDARWRILVAAGLKVTTEQTASQAHAKGVKRATYSKSRAAIVAARWHSRNGPAAHVGECRSNPTVGCRNPGSVPR